MEVTAPPGLNSISVCLFSTIGIFLKVAIAFICKIRHTRLY